ncbi:MAG: NAD(P) transhydrogenase subunit alpha [Sphingomonadales bacterium]|nr:NAD(P) transhydrogenase subunit alpha [Sphingomonadales bacterium]
MEFSVQEIPALIESVLPELYLLILAVFLGIEVIGRVPQVLHTPLMSGSNALSGVVVIGSILMVGRAEDAHWSVLVLASLALVLATVNVVGGFAVTARMLNMFRKKK